MVRYKTCVSLVGAPSRGSPLPEKTFSRAPITQCIHFCLFVIDAAVTVFPVSVVGNVDSGKSTLVGVLTSGRLDNGRGLARSNVFRHRFEIPASTRHSHNRIDGSICGFRLKPLHLRVCGFWPCPSCTRIFLQKSLLPSVSRECGCRQ